MTGGTAGTARGGPFDVDTDKALDALRAEWGGEYTVCYDCTTDLTDRWRAWRLGSIGVMLSGETPDKLAAAIRADRGAR